MGGKIEIMDSINIAIGTRTWISHDNPLLCDQACQSIGDFVSKETVCCTGGGGK